jgi:hypothetical protein
MILSYELAEFFCVVFEFGIGERSRKLLLNVDLTAFPREKAGVGKAR